ncbi:PSMD10 [Cordylochernes scorpioides]|nr:PSMD10 [Cordylochernes scorpioides]
MSNLEFCKLAYEGKVDKIIDQIKENKNIISKKDDVNENGRIALHWAASGGKIEVVNILLQYNSPLDLGDDVGWTPLMIASSVGNKDIVYALLARNADVNHSNSTGQTPLHYAASKNWEEV